MKKIILMIMLLIVSLQAREELTCIMKALSTNGVWVTSQNQRENTLYIMSDKYIIFGESLFIYSYKDEESPGKTYKAYFNGKSYLTIATDKNDQNVVITTPDGKQGLLYKCKR